MNTLVPPRPSGGFTLLELLIAVTLSAILALLMYRIIDAVLRSEQRISAHNQQLVELQRALQRIKQDLEQYIDRPRNSGYGEPVAALALSSVEGLSLSRHGWTLSALSPGLRSQLQAVQYQVIDSRDPRCLRAGDSDQAPQGALCLVRGYYRHLDQDDAEPYRWVVLLHSIEQWHWRVLYQDSPDQPAQWSTDWPLSTNASVVPTPLAIELTLEHSRFGPITRLVRLPKPWQWQGSPQEGG